MNNHLFGNDPDATNYVYQNVKKGSKIGSLPIYSDSNYIMGLIAKNKIGFSTF